ncbi:MAG: heparinase II/III family protein [Bacteroidales bacterium]|nr:heparinase II/III family protein [Bacteroidales bacterium]
MKRFLVGFIFFFVSTCFCLSAEGGANSINYDLLEKAGHPRLILDDAGFADLKAKISSTGTEYEVLKKLHGEVLKHAGQYLSKDVPIKHQLDGKRMLSQSRNALMQIFSYTYVYKTTGDVKYAQKVKDILLNVCSFSDWNPSHFLDTGEMALAVAIGYDWTYDYLGDEDKALILNALKTLALEPSQGHGFRHNEGNWNSVCYCGMLAAALVLYEHEKPLCTQLIEDLLVDNAKAVKGIYSPDGNYGEGYDYWGYGTSFQVLIFTMLQNIFGTTCGLDETAGLDKTAQFMLYMSSATKHTFTYADGGKWAEEPQVAIWWFAHRYGDKSVLCNELRFLKDGRYSRGVDRLFPLVPCIVKDIDLGNAKSIKPEKNIWSSTNGVPVVMVHTGWDFNRNDVYLGIKGGGAADCGHAHMDAGSFVFESNGYRWSDDYVRPDYGMVEREMKKVNGDLWTNDQKSMRWDVFKINNLSHSTISVMKTDGSVDKTHPSDHVAEGRAEILEVYDNDKRFGAKLDMTGPLADGVEKAERTIVLEGGKKLVVTDVITAKAGMSSSLQWRMNTPSRPFLCKNGIFLQFDGTYMLLSVKSEKTHIIPRLKIFSPVRPESWTPRTWDKDMKNSIIGFEVTVPAGEVCTFTTTLVKAQESEIRDANLCYSGYKTFTNLRYGKKRPDNPTGDPNMDRILDIAVPNGEKPAGGYPTVVFVHGGTFQVGSKTESAGIRFIQGFLEKGYAVVSLNFLQTFKLNKVKDWPLKGVYDPAYSKKFPDLKQAVDVAADDVKEALKWIAANGGEYGLDTKRIALMGCCSGSMAALQAVYKLKSPGVRCIVDLWGSLDPVSSISSKSCPVYVIHSLKDDMVDVRYGQDIYERALSMGLDKSRIEILDGNGHTHYNYVGKWVMPRIVEFVDDNMN